MVDLTVREYTDYDDFAGEWHLETLEEHDVTLEEARERGSINEDETRQLWQLMGQLDADELLFQIPEWLADEKVGYVDGATPTTFVGRIERETEKAVRLRDSAAARGLMKTAHRIASLEGGAATTDTDVEREAWLDDRLRQLRRQFEDWSDVDSLREEWLPKSQIRWAGRRV